MTDRATLIDEQTYLRDWKSIEESIFRRPIYDEFPSVSPFRDDQWIKVAFSYKWGYGIYFPSLELDEEGNPERDDEIDDLRLLFESLNS